MKLIMEHREADTFVLATGKSSTVREFTVMAFRAAGVDLAWRGTGVDEKASVPSQARCASRSILRFSVRPRSSC